VDLIRSNPAHREALQGHHPWDQHFTHNPWNRDGQGSYDHHRYYPYPYVFGFGFWPFWDPWWSFGYDRPYASRYVYCYDADPYDGVTYPAVSTTVSAATSAGDDQSATPSTETNADSGELSALRLYNGARDAFRTGDYRDALRLASHAAIESPQNVKVHELMSLARFALGDYRGAATEAHAAMAFGPVSDWATLSAHYGDPEAYTKQLRALEKYAGENKSAAEGHFLSAYHYLMVGARDDAKTQMALAVKLTPKDKLAAHVLQQLESGQPVTPPKAEPPQPPKPQPPQPSK
jgi:tetratricopeptide (TPR) repeat protein